MFKRIGFQNIYHKINNMCWLMEGPKKGFLRNQEEPKVNMKGLLQTEYNIS